MFRVPSTSRSGSVGPQDLSEPSLRRRLHAVGTRRACVIAEQRSAKTRKASLGQRLNIAEQVRDPITDELRVQYLKEKKICESLRDELQSLDVEISGIRDSLRHLVAQGKGRPPLGVSDHALVQYLALMRGEDLDALRHEVLQQVIGQPERVHNLSTSTFVRDGLCYVVRDGMVVSVVEPD